MKDLYFASCGDNYTNLDICLKQNHFGFIKDTAQEGQNHLLITQDDDGTKLHAIGTLGQPSKLHPWTNRTYPYSFEIKWMKLSEPINLTESLRNSAKFNKLPNYGLIIQGHKNLTLNYKDFVFDLNNIIKKQIDNFFF